MSDIVIRRPDPGALAAEANQYVVASQALVVSTDESRVDALVVAKALRSIERKIVDHYEPTRKALDTAKKELLAARDSLTEPIQRAVGIIDRKCEGFEREQKAKAEAERVRLEAEARERQEAQRLMDAAMAESKEEAERVMAEELPEPVVVVPPPVSKVAGVSTATTWDVEITDKAAFLQFVAANSALHYLVEPNLVALKSVARSIKPKDGDIGIAGIKAVEHSNRRFAR